MKTKGFLARISVIVAIIFSQSLADSNAIDSNQSSVKFDSAPPIYKICESIKIPNI